MVQVVGLDPTIPKATGFEPALYTSSKHTCLNGWSNWNRTGIFGFGNPIFCPLDYAPFNDYMVGLTRLERAIFSLGGSGSVQLSYNPI